MYPFVKSREWYALPAEERYRIMQGHIRVGREYPQVDNHTVYSFGLDDQEFVVAFDTDDPASFLELVQRLRATEASRYTVRDTPSFTCIAASLARALERARRRADPARDGGASGLADASDAAQAAVSLRRARPRLEHLRAPTPCSAR